MSKETKHNRRSFLGTTAVSIITAEIALMGSAQASFNRVGVASSKELNLKLAQYKDL